MPAHAEMCTEMCVFLLTQKWGEKLRGAVSVIKEVRVKSNNPEEENNSKLVTENLIMFTQML